MTDVRPENLLAETAWLRRLARGLLQNGEADDLAQDAMASALAYRGAIEQPRPFLAAVLRNARARQRRRAVLRAQAEVLAARPEALPDTAAIVARAELQRAAVDAVLGLAEPYRSAVLLRYLDGLSLRAVATRLGVPGETARTRIKRGLAMVRSRLDREPGGRAAWLAALLPGTSVRAAAVAVGVALVTAKTELLVAAALFAVALSTWAVLALSVAGPPVDAVPAKDPAPQAIIAPASERPARVAVARMPAAAGEPAQQRATATAFAGGIVVDEESGAPIGDASVRWRDDGELASVPSPETTTTDATGRFTLPTAHADPQHALQVEVSARDRAVVDVPLGEPTRNGARQRFDVGTIRVPPGTGLGGHVVDPDGSAVADAELLLAPEWVYALNGGFAYLPLAREVGRTHADGSFRLAERYVPGRRAPLLLAVSPAGMGWVEVELHRQRTDVDDLVVRLLPAHRLVVEVTDARSAPVAGAEVALDPHFAPISPDDDRWAVSLGRHAGLEHLLRAKTDAAGRARFEGLPLSGSAARYAVRVHAPGHAGARVDRVVPSGAGTSVRVTLPDAVTWSVAGTITDPGGAAVVGATVTASGEGKVSATSGADGRYRVEVRPSGATPSFVTVHADGYVDAQRTAAPAASETSVTADFVLQPGQPLFGLVVDQHGEAVPKASVGCWQVGSSAWTDEAGRFRLPAVPADRMCDVNVVPPDDVHWSGSVQHSAKPGDSPLTLVLTRLPPANVRLSVRLLDEHGAALEPRSAWLTRLPAGDARRATTRIGEVTATDLCAGSWRLDIDVDHGHALSHRFEIGAGDDEVRFTLAQQTAGTIEGQVVVDSDDGTQPERLKVTVDGPERHGRFAPVEGQPYAEAAEDAVTLDLARGARFRIVDVDPSRILSVETDDDRWIGSASVRVGAGEVASMRLVVRRVAHLLLRASQPWPTDEVTLRLRRAGEAWGEPLRLGQLQGRTTLMNWPLAPGHWEWQVTLPTMGSSNRGAATVLDGAVDLSPGGDAVVALDPGLR